MYFSLTQPSIFNQFLTFLCVTSVRFIVKSNINIEIHNIQMKTSLVIFLLLITIITSQPIESNIFTLTFQYAARQTPNNPLGTSLANALWNNVILLSIVPADYNVNTVSVDVTAVEGANLLQFEGAGPSDTFGFDFTNVQLIKKGDPTNTNLVMDGDFSAPYQYGGYWIYDGGAQGRVVVGSGNGGWGLAWGGPHIQIGTGPGYNPNWPVDIQLCELDANSNIQITQILTFDSNFQLIPDIVPAINTPCSSSPTLGSFTLQFDWAPTTAGAGANNLLTSQANILWNNVIIDSLVPSGPGIQHATYQVMPNSCIDNVLQFDGTSTSDGIGLTIANVQFYSSSDASHTNFPTFINGNFQQPVVGAGLAEMGATIPGWTVFNSQIGDCTIYNSEWTAGSGQCIILDSTYNQRYMQIIPMRDSPIGIGIVGPLTKTAFGCILEQGYTWAIVNAEEGSPVAIQTLQNAQSGGLSTAIYLKLCRGTDPIAQVQTVLGAIPQNLYSDLWMKAEPNSATGCSWDGYSQADNCVFLTKALTVVVQNLKDTGVFTTPRIWKKFFGSTCNSVAQAGFDLFYADYHSTGHVDTSLSFSDFTAFGGWSAPVMKQTVGNTTVTLCNHSGWHAYLDFFWQP